MKKKSLILILIFLIIIFLITILFSTSKVGSYTIAKDKHRLSNDTIIIDEIPIKEINISKTSQDNVKATIYKDGVLIISGTGSMMDNINIDSWYTTYASNAKEIIISEGVENIGDEMFVGFSKLQSIEIPSTVSTIGFAFIANTNVSQITVSENNPMFYTDNGVLYTKGRGSLVAYAPNKSESAYQIPEGITKINSGAFIGTKNLETLRISKDITEIPIGTFSETKKLSSIIVNENNIYFSSQAGVLFNKDKTKLLCYPNKLTQTSYTVPEGVMTIEKDAFFADNDLRELILTEGINDINSQAFYGCKKIETITLPKSVTNINKDIFIECNSLRKIYVHCNSYAATFTSLESFSRKNSQGVIGIVEVEVLHEYKNNICQDCGRAKGEHTHVFGTWTVKKSATCIEEGIKERKCIHCDVKETQVLPVTDHTYSEWTVTKRATKTETGTKSRSCIICGHTETDVIPKLSEEDPGEDPGGDTPGETIPEGYILKTVSGIKYIIIPRPTSVAIALNKFSDGKQLKIVNSNGDTQSASTKIATGFKIATKSDNKVKYTIVAKGDLNSDGLVTIRDIISANSLRESTSTNNQNILKLLAGDFNENGSIDIRDIISINSLRE